MRGGNEFNNESCYHHMHQYHLSLEYKVLYASVFSVKGCCHRLEKMFFFYWEGITPPPPPSIRGIPMIVAELAVWIVLI